MALAAESLQPSERKILSVAELTRRIKKSIEDTIRTVWVTGEISNYRGLGVSDQESPPSRWCGRGMPVSEAGREGATPSWDARPPVV